MPVHTGESPTAMGVICLSTWFFVALVTDSSEEEVYFLVKKKNVQTYNLHALKSSNQKSIWKYKEVHVLVKQTFHMEVIVIFLK